LFIPPGFLLVLNRRKQVMTSFFFSRNNNFISNDRELNLNRARNKS
jgi:hypothetical protein